MRISEIQVDDFGAWHNLTLDNLGTGATVFYGPNEAGKTTLLNIIRTAFYGFSEKRCRKYLPPAQGSRAGGSLVVDDVTGQFRIARSAPADYLGGQGTLQIQSQDGNRRGSDLLTTLLCGIDETIFNNVFAVGLTQIQALSTLSDTEAANQLYGLATGVDRVSLFEVTKALERERDAILPSSNADNQGDPSHGRIDALLAQKTRLEKELKALRRDAGVHAKLRRDFRELTHEIKEKEKAGKLLDRKAKWSEHADEIRKNWSRCRQINDRLARMGPLPDIPPHVTQRIKNSFEQVKELRREWEQISAERKRIKEKAAKYRGRDMLYHHAAEIQALDRQRDRILSLETGVKQARATVDEIEFEIQAEMEALGLQVGTSSERLPAISDDVIEALRGPARETRELREAAETTRKLAQTHRTEAEAIKAKLEAAAKRFGGEDITLAIRKRTQLIKSLETRLGLDEQREGIVRQLDEVGEEVSYWQRRSVLPWRRIVALCGVFSAGVMLVLAGFLHNKFQEIQPEHFVPLVTIGGALTVISIVAKNTLENAAAERAEVGRHRLERMQEDYDRAVAESQELEQRLRASGSGHLDQRLIDAREELLQLEQFVPLTERYESLSREADAAEYQATHAVRLLKDSRREWKASLRTVGLPESLTPAQIGEMSGRVSDLTRLRQRLAEAKRDLTDRTQEFHTIRERVEQLFAVGEIHPVPEGLNAQLTRLMAQLEKHTKSGKERDTLKQRWEHLHDKQQRLSSSAQQIVQTRQQLLDAHGLTGMVDFQESVARAAKSRKMRRERNRRLQKISELTDKQHSPRRLQEMLDAHSSELVERLETLARQKESLGNDLHSMQQRATVMKQKLDGQLQDRRCEQKELALQCIEEQIVQAWKHWRRAAMVAMVLDKVKQTYETKRQPVALAEASTHLQRLTEDRYVRIWTPMGRDELCVDDHHGSVLSVEKLSRGTRELVFLALRLALVSSYQRRGASMPIVLDDVFVNFDDRRAQAVARVLADVANNGQQMLIFTCHDRIRSIFHQLGHDVRDLPLRPGLTARELPPLPAPIQRDSAIAEVSAVDPEPETTPEPAPPPPPKPIDREIDEVPAEAAADDVAPIAEVEELPPVAAEPTGSIQRRVDDDFDQFTPAWRDEWLEPLPDIAPSGDAEES